MRTKPANDFLPEQQRESKPTNIAIDGALSVDGAQPTGSAIPFKHGAIDLFLSLLEAAETARQARQHHLQKPVDVTPRTGCTPSCSANPTLVVDHPCAVAPNTGGRSDAVGSTGSVLTDRQVAMLARWWE
jgi:hypothetical protein